eukprot:6473819-Amphidinium_carterae.3
MPQLRSCLGDEGAQRDYLHYRLAFARRDWVCQQQVERLQVPVDDRNRVSAYATMLHLVLLLWSLPPCPRSMPALVFLSRVRLPAQVKQQLTHPSHSTDVIPSWEPALNSSLPNGMTGYARGRAQCGAVVGTSTQAKLGDNLHVLVGHNLGSAR